MRQKFWISLITYLSYCIDKEFYQAIDYLKSQVEVLVEQQEKQNKRILLTHQQRMRVAAKAKRLSRKMLEQCTVLFTPDTIMGWYNQLIAVRPVKLFWMTVRLYTNRPDLLFCQQ